MKMRNRLIQLVQRDHCRTGRLWREIAVRELYKIEIYKQKNQLRLKLIL